MDLHIDRTLQDKASAGAKELIESTEEEIVIYPYPLRADAPETGPRFFLSRSGDGILVLSIIKVDGQDVYLGIKLDPIIKRTT